MLPLIHQSVYNEPITLALHPQEPLPSQSFNTTLNTALDWYHSSPPAASARTHKSTHEAGSSHSADATTATHSLTSDTSITQENRAKDNDKASDTSASASTSTLTQESGDHTDALSGTTSDATSDTTSGSTSAKNSTNKSQVKEGAEHTSSDQSAQSAQNTQKNPDHSPSTYPATLENTPPLGVKPHSTALNAPAEGAGSKSIQPAGSLDSVLSFSTVEAGNQKGIAQEFAQNNNNNSRRQAAAHPTPKEDSTQSRPKKVSNPSHRYQTLSIHHNDAADSAHGPRTAATEDQTSARMPTMPTLELIDRFGLKPHLPHQNHTLSAMNQELRSFLQTTAGESILKHARLVLKGAQEGEVRLLLKPEELGTMRVNLHLNNNILNGRILVDNQVTRLLLDQNLPEMLRAFREQGLEVGNFEVSLRHGATSNHAQSSGREVQSYSMTLKSAESQSILTPIEENGLINLYA